MPCVAWYAGRLSTESQGGDKPAIPVNLLIAQVFEQATTLSDHLEQTPTAVMVVLVSVEMVAQVVDPRREERDLHLRAACPVLVGLVPVDDLLLVDSHAGFRVSRVATPGTWPGGQPLNVAGGGSGRKVRPV